jgi:putative peptidoglycan lipid II flippase
MNRARHLLQSSLIVIVLFGLDKLLGLLRTQLVGETFGTSPAFDAFTAANQLPEVFVTLVSGGALAAAFIPVYSAYLNSPRAREAARLANATITLVLIILSIISAIGAILAPWLVSNYLASGFSPELQTLTADLMRIILVQTTIFGVSGVLSSILNAHQHFVLPALAPMALHIGYLFGLFFLVPEMGIYGLAWGTVVGGLLHILIQVPGLRRYRFHFRPVLGLKMTGIQEIARLMGPRIVTLGTVQIADLFIINITSGLASGSTSGYFFGYYLQQLPETLFGTAIAIVVFPTLAEYFNAGRIKEMVRTAINTLHIIWWLTIPTAALLILLGRPAIVVFLERGEFTPESTAVVYGVLVFFSLRVVSEATLEILARLFYAQHNTRTPMFVALLWLVIAVGLSYLLVAFLGLGGLALASSIAFTVQVIVLYFLLRRKLGDMGDRESLLALGRATVATIGMGIVVFLVLRPLANPWAQLFIGGGVGVAVYLFLSRLLGGREISQLIALVRNR